MESCAPLTSALIPSSPGLKDQSGRPQAAWSSILATEALSERSIAPEDAIIHPQTCSALFVPDKATTGPAGGLGKKECGGRGQVETVFTGSLQGL